MVWIPGGTFRLGWDKHYPEEAPVHRHQQWRGARGWPHGAQHVLVEVKKPKESKGTWNYYKLLAEVPGDQTFRPLKDRLPVSEVTEIELEWYRLQAQQTPH